MSSAGELRSPQASASASYLRSHEQSDLVRTVQSLQTDIAAKDAELARLRLLTDKGQLQVPHSRPCIRIAESPHLDNLLTPVFAEKSANSNQHQQRVPTTHSQARGRGGQHPGAEAASGRSCGPAGKVCFCECSVMCNTPPPLTCDSYSRGAECGPMRTNGSAKRNRRTTA